MVKIKDPKHKEYQAEYLNDFEEPVFEPKEIPGLNDDTINSDISIE